MPRSSCYCWLEHFLHSMLLLNGVRNRPLWKSQTDRMLAADDLSSVVAMLPRELVAAMEAGGPAIAICGGFIRAVVCNDVPRDIDVYVQNETALQFVIGRLAIGRPHFKGRN